MEKGVILMTNNPEFMTVEHMYLAEEFFYSACELKQFEWAQFFLRMVRNQFPKSVKSIRMLAIFHESVGDIEKAQEIYLDMIE